MIGLAKKAGRVEIGEEPVGSAARSKHARVILVASDAAAGSVRRAYAFAQTGACLCLTIPADKDALGRALGRSSCAMAAVTDVGFADAIVKKLAAMDPEHYEQASQRLQIKARRAMGIFSSKDLFLSLSRVVRVRSSSRDAFRASSPNIS